LDSLLRSLVVGKLGRNGEEKIVEEARKRFENHLQKTNQLKPDLRSPVYTTVLAHGDESTFEKVLQLLKEADLQEEKVRCMRSLGAVKQENLIKKILEYSLSNEVRAQDTVACIAGATGSVLGRELSWKFVQDNWAVLLDRYKGFLLARLIKTTTENFVTEEKAQEVETFFQKNKTPAAERTISQSLENVRLNAAQLKRDTVAIKAFLESRK